jgi:hypothetical protein
MPPAVQTNKQAPPLVGRQERQYMKSISALICAAVLLGSMAMVRAESCCDKAKAAGKECSHECCKKAKADGKVCEKCNPKKDDKKK